MSKRRNKPAVDARAVAVILACGQVIALLDVLLKG